MMHVFIVLKNQILIVDNQITKTDANIQLPTGNVD